ncbi:MAG: divalent-cation tolerance protein CutA [Candidatus Omnitrophota bacterium]
MTQEKFPNRYVQVTTTTDSKDLAERIAQTLVEKKLAACVQISGPISSTYEWQNQIETTEEYCCTIKTRMDLYHAVEASIKAMHAYVVPEIIALPIITGNPDYLQWIDDVTKEPLPVPSA